MFQSHPASGGGNRYDLDSPAIMSLIIKLRILMGVVGNMLILVFLSVFVWILIFFTLIYAYLPLFHALLNWVCHSVVKVHMLIRIQCNDHVNSENGSRFLIGRRVANASIEERALWDRWLDG